MNGEPFGRAPVDREIGILLLEDSEIDAELLAAHLDKAEVRFRLHRVASRRDFIAALERSDTEIVLADYSLPEFDGLSALNIARALRPDMPFIFVSGVVGEEFATNALKRGAADYVMKRNLARLATAVERALEQSRERAERLKAEAALKRSEMSAHLAIEAAQLGVWDYDPRSGELKLDERCRTLFGCPPGVEVSFAGWLEGCRPEERARIEQALVDFMTPGAAQTDTFQDEFGTVAPDGTERWVTVRGRAQFEEDVCTRFVGVVRDVTEERRAQVALRRRSSTLEQEVVERTLERDRIWRLSPDLFAVIDLGGRFRRLNPAWITVLGYDPEKLVGSNIRLLLHPDEPNSAGSVRGTGGTQLLDRSEDRLRHADGSWRWIAWTAVPEGDAFYAVGRDVTAEKEAVAALAERNRQLAAQIEERERVEDTLRQMQRLEAVGQLTSGVAHDFNNLLTVILGNIMFIERALSRPTSDNRIGERIGYMRTAAERGAKLTAQLLAFSRRQKLEPRPVDLNEAVASMGDLLRSTMGGTVRMETILRPGLWPALVDPTQIELIVLNLAINARDAMEVGGALTVETANVRLANPPSRPEEPMPGDYVLLSVSDTGSGMTGEVLAKAFEPFFTTKEIGKGSGLGLAQVYGFVKQSGGGVRIETKLGEGTSVRVYLPCAAGAVEPEEASATVVPIRRSPGATVLLVDDDQAVREITAAMLLDLGYAVVQAGSGAAALDVVRGGEPLDLMLLDFAMPGMNGAEVERAAARLRPDLRSLFITGYADLKALEHVGEDRIIRKPFGDEELNRKMAAVLGRHGEDRGLFVVRR